MKLRLLLCAGVLAVTACAREETESNEMPAPESETTGAPMADKPESAEQDEQAQTAEERLDAVLAAQAEEIKARYPYRHPKETLMFFGVEPGMTVVDTLPGEPGWYTKILLSYLGPEGKLIGADYPAEMWALFGDYSPPPEQKANWAADWTEAAEGWREESDAAVGAFAYGAVPDDMAGTADVVLVLRALHHFSRFEDEGDYLTSALADINKVLKPGGVVGVVQHRAPAGNSDEWASGDNGYIKQDDVIAAFEGAGFEFVEASEINANPNDQPTEDDIVWRLPPTLGTSAQNPELRAQMEAIGESDRMTLKFRKP